LEEEEGQELSGKQGKGGLTAGSTSRKSQEEENSRERKARKRDGGLELQKKKKKTFWQKKNLERKKLVESGKGGWSYLLRKSPPLGKRKGGKGAGCTKRKR